MPDPSGRGRVLIVDDNAALVDNLAEILDEAGYRVERAATCAQARAAAERGFDVALVDVRLPDGSGIELGRELRDEVPSGEVILLTGHASTESAAQAVRAGAFAYLVKPTATHDLLLTIEQAQAKVRLAAERVELLRRASRAEKLAAVGTLAAGLSHEIRNPLNAAALQLTVLERRLRKQPGLPETVFEPLQLVQVEIKRLSVILEEFLQFARPRDLVRAPLDLGKLVQSLLELLRPEAEAAPLTLEARLDAVPPILGDEDRLKQALLNLLLNAIQATPPHGWVRVEVRRDGAAGVRISVEDSGPGIPPELRERIFEPFFTTKEKGSGLGLPLVYSVVQLHGGTIALDAAPGGGARFVVTLPPR